MHDLFEQENTEAILLVDAANAFNSINRNVFLHNVSVVCPEIAIYVKNCYSLPSRLFIIGGFEIKSAEGTTQGDPIAMALYAVAIIPLLLMIVEITTNSSNNPSKVVAFADDFTASGTTGNLKLWWNTLCQLGPKFGYNPGPSKSWLIVKDSYFTKASQLFNDTEIKVTTKGKRHLGAVIGSEEFKTEYINSKIATWIEELRILCQIAKIEPQAAFSCFIGGFKHKLTYCLRTIPDIGDLVQKFDNVISTEFIPAITGGITLSTLERKLVSLPAKLGGLGIPIFSQISQSEYTNSIEITKKLKSSIKQQNRQYDPDEQMSKIKNKIKSEKVRKHKYELANIVNELTDHQKQLNLINQEAGASSWLTTLPIKDEGYVLHKQLFWDLIRIRYGWELSRLPENCECGSKFTIEHALSCKKGGFVSIRHNSIRNITATLLKEVCHDVRVEPNLTKLTGEEFSEKTANLRDEARSDVCARGFWTTGQMAFFDIRVFNPIAKRYSNKEIAKTYEINEKEKKKQYNERILQVEHGTFTPLVMSATGGMGRECQKFYTRLSESVAEKRGQNYSVTVSWIRRKICFSLINSLGLCLRGSRNLYNNNEIIVKSIQEDSIVSETTSSIR